MGWRSMMKRLLVLTCSLTLPLSAAAAQQVAVHLEPQQLHGSRPIEKQTEAAVIRDYLAAWKSLQSALDLNQPALLDTNFVGPARDKLTSTIADQSSLGIHVRYQERSHDLQFVFYSPEGSSIQLIDTVEYDEQVLDHDKVLATKPLRQRYLVVLTPSEVRWRVRLFQADTQ